MLENKYNHSLLHGSNVNIIIILTYILYINLTKKQWYNSIERKWEEKGKCITCLGVGSEWRNKSSPSVLGSPWILNITLNQNVMVTTRILFRDIDVHLKETAKNSKWLLLGNANGSRYINKPYRSISVLNLCARTILTKIQIFKKYHHLQEYCDIITGSIIILRDRIQEVWWHSWAHTITGVSSVLNSLLMIPNLMYLSGSSPQQLVNKWSVLISPKGKRQVLARRDQRCTSLRCTSISLYLARRDQEISIWTRPWAISGCFFAGKESAWMSLLPSLLPQPGFWSGLGEGWRKGSPQHDPWYLMSSQQFVCLL